MNFNMAFILYYMIVNKFSVVQDSKCCIFISCCLQEVSICVHRRTGRNYV